MQDLSLHILDISQNSIRANASEVSIYLKESPSINQLCLEIVDNGQGMTKEIAEQVTDPFITTRTLRRVGLGLPLLKQNCENCEGKLEIQSNIGEGTRIVATMAYNHIDRVPIGDIASTLVSLIQGAPKVNFIYVHDYESNSFHFSTVETQMILQDVPIENLEVLMWLKAYLSEQINFLSSNS